MPSSETLQNFVQLVEENKHDTAIKRYYTEDASIQENQDEPRIGRNLLVENERKFMAIAKSMTSKCIHPILVNDNNAVIRWVFRFEWKNGTVTKMEELAYQIWRGEKIFKEQFFYNPVQRIPK